MAVYEALSEAEACLYAILQDESGIDLAEFAVYSAEHEDGCWRAWPFQYCLAGETIVITRDGHRAIRELAGTTPTILTKNSRGLSKWVSAPVRSFGAARIWEIDVAHSGFVKTIRATAQHRWYADQRRRARRRYPEVRTADLQPGMFLQSVEPRRPGNLKLTPYGVAHGLVWGDGTLETSGQAHLNLWGEKLQCGSFLFGDGTELNRDDVAVPGRSWTGMPREFKERVRLDESPSYLYSWLAGYFATDGYVAPDGTCQINSADPSSIELVRDVCLRLGIKTGPATLFEIRDTDSYGQGDVDSWTVTIVASDLSAEFFLRDSHLNHWLGRTSTPHVHREWKVIGVRETMDVEEVFCASVPESHSFALDGYILTGNSWWRCTDALQIDQCGRAVGKSQSILQRGLVFPFVQPGQEMLITAPEKVHLDAITSKLEQQILATRITREMLVGKGGRNSFRHTPFEATFVNQSRIIGRIPQRDGSGIKGTHPIWLEMDEAQDYPDPAGWVELAETLKRGTRGARRRSHGVTKGTRGHFYKNTQPGSGWTTHHLTAMHRPNWTDEERQEKIQQYGSVDDPDYRRNILGAHGDASQNLFVLHRLMAVVDQDESSTYNTEVYHYARITDEMRNDAGIPVSAMLELPRRHKAKEYINYWCGMDVGMTIHPSEIAVFGEVKGEKKDDPTILRLLTRINMQRLSAPHQEDAIKAVLDFYKPVIFAMDSTGVGLPIYQQLQHEAPEHLHRIRGYNFSSKILVDIDLAVEVDTDLGGDLVKDAGIQKNVLEHAQDQLRDFVDGRRIRLPWDRNLIGQFEGGTATALARPDQYGRRRVFSGGEDHFLDASRLAVLGYTQWHLEQIVNQDKREDVLDIFMEY